MSLSPEDLRHIVARTVGRCGTQAQTYWQGTRNQDVSQNVQAFLTALRGAPPLGLLDQRCGPGRDLRKFTAMGHRNVGLEGSSHMAALDGSHNSLCEVLEQSLLALELPSGYFDGVFANAVRVHVPFQEPAVGVLFSSTPRGSGPEGWNGDRYGAFHGRSTWHRHLPAAGFDAVTHFYRPPGVPIERQPWPASMWRKPDGSSAQPPTTHARA